MEDHLLWKTTFDERRPSMEDDHIEILFIPQKVLFVKMFVFEIPEQFLCFEIINMIQTSKLITSILGEGVIEVSGIVQNFV